MEERRKLPKNVRQVGERDELYRIYLEDYVGTYLEKCMSRQGELTVGVLVGENCVIDGNACLFIVGALEVNHVWADGDQLLFSEYSWERMLDVKSRHFTAGDICGCFVCAGEEIIPDISVLQKLQNRYFPETGSVMLVQSREDSSMYYQSMAGMSRLSGYYIYYERNEAMQRFLVENSQGRVVERTGDEVVVNQFREKMTEKKNMRNPAGLRLAYGLCACLALAVCAIGFNTLGSNQKITQMEQLMTGFMEQNAQVGATVSETDGAGGRLTIYDVSDGAQEETSGVSAQKPDESGAEQGTESALTENHADATDAAEVPGETGAESAGVLPEETGEAPAGVLPEETGEEAVGVLPEETGDEPAGVLPEVTEAEPASALPEGCVLYRVQPGDTLSSICVRLYGSHEQLENICVLNGLEDANLISEGQELIIPAYVLSQDQEISPEEVTSEPIE